LAGIIAGEEEGCMVIAEGNHVGTAINQFLLETFVKLREF